MGLPPPRLLGRRPPPPAEPPCDPRGGSGFGEPRDPLSLPPPPPCAHPKFCKKHCKKGKNAENEVCKAECSNKHSEPSKKLKKCKKKCKQDGGGEDAKKQLCERRPALRARLLAYN